jgi:hypothetical protein
MNGDLAAASRTGARAVVVHENYGPYRPPFEVSADIERLLSALEPRYVIGLNAVVLSAHRALTRERRRAKTKARGRKIAIREAHGLYHREWFGRPASIELFVDAMLEGFPRFVFRWPTLRDLILSRVLFHELGHHLHATQSPEHDEPESVAERWRLWLTREAFAKLHPRSLPFLRTAAHLLKPVRSWMYRRYRRRVTRGVA